MKIVCVIPFFKFQLIRRCGNNEIKRREVLVRQIIMKRQKPEFCVLIIVNYNYLTIRMTSLDHFPFTQNMNGYSAILKSY